MRCLVAVFLLVLAAPSGAQVISRPTDPPIVTAENDSWYRLREPLVFAGDQYFPAGAAVFFNGNTMVRTGHFNGVPLYADTTIEPYSIVYVPIGRGLLQPYERVRRAELAGSVGSRTPSFPVRSEPERRDVPMAAAPPTAMPQPVGAISVLTPEPGAVATAGRSAPPRVAGTTAVVAPRPMAVGVATVRRAESNDGIWLQFMGERWVSAGSAVPLRAGEFVQVGEYAGFPVYARQGLNEERIYIPTAADGGLLAPFRLED